MLQDAEARHGVQEGILTSTDKVWDKVSTSIIYNCMSLNDVVNALSIYEEG